MIDIHSHLVFGVDDGPQTIQETQALLEDAVEQGITTIVATPHYRKGMFEASDEEVYEKFQQTCEIAKAVNPQLQLLLGREIYCHSSEELPISSQWTLGNTKLVLLEFRQDSHYAEIYNSAYKLLTQNYTVVLAHIERYPQLTVDQIDKLKGIGCFIQVNASNIERIRLFDPYSANKKRVQLLLKRRLIDVVASDVHNKSTRPYKMKQAYKIIKNKYGSQYAEQLFLENAKKLLAL